MRRATPGDIVAGSMPGRVWPQSPITLSDSTCRFVGYRTIPKNVRILLVGAGIALASTGASSQGVDSNGESARWREFARADLESVRETIIAAHPGAIDEQNPSFRTWMNDGYVAALSLLPRVRDYSTALSAVRFYVAGFEDGHLSVSDNVRPDEPVRFHGWAVRKRQDDYIVSAVAEGWTAPLPPVGATLVECDGRSPSAIVREDIAPYRDRRALASSEAANASRIGWPIASFGNELGTCIFELEDDSRLELAVAYKAVSFADMVAIDASKSRKPRSNSFVLKDGLLWIRAGNFDLKADQVAPFRKLLEELRHQRGVTRIVFDMRGNGGGDSRVGDLIFNAATGGIEYDRRGIEQLPRTVAHWRVSEVAVETARRGLAKAIRTFGPHSIQADWNRKHLKGLLAAKASGRPWVRQGGGDYRVTREEVTKRGGRLRRFSGRLAVLTDSNCASACLDFVDQVKLVPGALHLGATTSADSVYIDVGQVDLPSGNSLVIPLKVWRNRLRADNEPLIPDRVFPGDLNDDQAVHQWMLTTLSLD